MSKLMPIELKNQRIILTENLAEQYGTEIVRIQQNYLRNKERFVEGKHFYKLQGEELKQFKTDYLKDSSLKINSLMLWTEKGAARHAKILDTDEAWEVYKVNYLDVIADDKKLINGYIGIVGKLAIKHGIKKEAI